MPANPLRSIWRCRCGAGASRFPCRMPPEPGVVAALFKQYRGEAKAGVSFSKYLQDVGFVDPSVTVEGMDDRLLLAPTPAGLARISLPTFKVVGNVRVQVLMVDFEDRVGVDTPDHYRELLFSEGSLATGSMRDYFAEVSQGKVEVSGTVHGWIRMPEKYTFYLGSKSGLDEAAYPNNAKRLAEHAVAAALAQGVSFDSRLDFFGQGFVTALFIVHAGRGAESQPGVAAQRKEIWSHKWDMKNPVQVAPNLMATTYLAVPHNCAVGVCAHELGHLAFQWQDFYDPNFDEDGETWDGSGTWDLMAGGAHNGRGKRPAHPAALHKIQHGWVEVDKVRVSGVLTLPPYDAANPRVCKIVTPAFNAKQYLLLENRRRQGFDADLPGQGLLVWKVDEAKEMFGPAAPGMLLVQADGKHELETAGDDSDDGDDGDPFPGVGGDKTALGDDGDTSTSFPGARSGVRLSDIRVQADGSIRLNVEIGT